MAKRKSMVSTAKKNSSKVKSTARKAKVSIKSAAVNSVPKARSARVNSVPKASSAADLSATPLASAANIQAPAAPVSTALPLGQSIDLQQQIIRNADNSNVFDPAIGYGLALPGETGTAAVERIKTRRKARVNKKK